MLQQAGMKLEFWAEALQTVVYLMNLSPLKAIMLEVLQTLWLGKEPTYDRLRMRSLHIHPTGEKDQIGTPCNEMHISWLWNRWGILI